MEKGVEKSVFLHPRFLDELKDLLSFIPIFWHKCFMFWFGRNETDSEVRVTISDVLVLILFFASLSFRFCHGCLTDSRYFLSRYSSAVPKECLPKWWREINLTRRILDEGALFRIVADCISFWVSINIRSSLFQRILLNEIRPL